MEEEVYVSNVGDGWRGIGSKWGGEGGLGHVGEQAMT